MIEVKGLKEVIGNLNKYSAKVRKEIDATLTDGANKIEERAKFLAPVDEGLMRGNIIATTNIPFDKIVTCNTFYAPYIEFGTKGKFKGNGRDAIAAQFKGKSGRGDYFDFLNAILDWVIRKGIEATVSPKTGKKINNATNLEKQVDAAQAIANAIMRYGIKPQPFFFKAYDEIMPTILLDLKTAIKK